jgi:programmed cell death protein 5
VHCAVARIALVKPEKAKGVEDVILRAAQMGQIAEKVY